jgi:hypothetical protein
LLGGLGTGAEAGPGGPRLQLDPPYETDGQSAYVLRCPCDPGPNDPFVLLNLGSIAVERQDGRAALDFLRRSLSGSAPTDSITRKLIALIARCHQMLGDLPGALAVCAECLSFDPSAVELLFRNAETTWRRILTFKRPEQSCSVDQGIYGRLTLHNLAALAAERSDHAEARRL